MSLTLVIKDEILGAVTFKLLERGLEIFLLDVAADKINRFIDFSQCLLSLEGIETRGEIGETLDH
jgi:hypothetical protein